MDWFGNEIIRINGHFFLLLFITESVSFSRGWNIKLFRKSQGIACFRDGRHLPLFPITVKPSEYRQWSSLRHEELAEWRQWTPLLRAACELTPVQNNGGWRPVRKRAIFHGILCNRTASGSLLETLAAHDGALWSISLSPDQRGFVTGGADKCVKFWDFELVKDENGTQKRLSMKQTRILQLDEDVLCVRYSPNQKLLAISLLDCTVKIFYTDTLKFFLSLYGHKLPVLCMDISYDGALIATGSADRNVKIWGLDFGDCHRSLFAHDDSVMTLQFVHKSHLFFTAGKDHKIKQWDADKFEHIQTLEGHHQEVWCLALSPSGDYIVSSSHDKSLRLWERTREPLILEEEREMQREAEYEESVAKEEQPVVAGETQGETGLAGKKTIETVKAAERIMEAIELYREETAKLKEHQAICKAAGKEVPLPVNPILQAYGNISPSAYVLEVFKKVKSSELEESLLVLPFSYVPDLLVLFNEHVQWGSEVELLCRALLFLLRIHFGRITSNQLLVTVIENLKKTTISKVSEVRNVLGFNMAGLQFLKREVEAKDEVTFFADATDRFEEKRRKRKKKEKLVLAMV